jgi:ATP-dependent Lhr-like helicase
VFLAGGDEARRGAGRRVGELDEEMVYESRVGDVFTLGSSSWRIEEITHDRVLVTPAPGSRASCRSGTATRRAARRARAGPSAASCASSAGSTTRPPRARARASGLDAWAADNLVAYLRDQQEATRHLPDDRTLVVERFRDELGDWRVVVHSPFGGQVHAPWALAVAARSGAVRRRRPGDARRRRPGAAAARRRDRRTGGPLTSPTSCCSSPTTSKTW